MRYYIFLSISILLVIALSSCEKQEQKATEANALKIGFIYVSPVGDGGWTWAHDQGRKELEKLPFVATTRMLESVPEAADAKRAIAQFANQGFQLIFTTSFGYMDPTIEIAQQYPQHIFMHCSGYKTASNVGTYFGRIYEARYLTGIVAGKMTKSNIIGYVAAYPIPEVIRGINAFALGVQSVNPQAQVRVVWSHTWYDPGKERQCAESLLDVGADVLAQHQDSGATQQAAQDRGKYSIGYHSNMQALAPKAHLTSAVWNWGKLYKHIAESVHQKTWKSEKIWWGMSTGLVDISPLNTALVPADMQQFIESKRQEIISGSAKIFYGPISDQQGKIRIPANTLASDEELLSMDYFIQGVVGSIEKGQ